jgi:hypothetical protein
MRTQGARRWLQRLLLLPPTPEVAGALWHACKFLSGAPSEAMQATCFTGGMQIPPMMATPDWRIVPENRRVL